MFLFSVILGFLTILMWHKVYSHYLMGESLTYFRDGYEQILGMTYPGIEGIFRYDIFARITFTSFEYLFKDNLLPFNIFLLIILVLLSISFLFMVYKLTDNKNIAFMSSIFFGLNFIFLGEMIGFGFFQWVYERVPNFIFSFISFFFFVKYLKQNNYKYYYISLLLFSISILAAHFSLFFLPFFVFYSILFTLFEEKERKNLKKRIFEFLPFVLIAYFLVTSKPSVPPTPKGKTFMDTLTDKDLFSDVFYQITMVSLPLQIFDYLGKHFDIRSLIPKLYLPIALFYIFSSFIFLNLKKQWGIVLIACFLSLIAVSILNLHVHKMSTINWRPDLTNHYYMTLGFFVSIFWSIILYYFAKKNKVFTSIVIIFIIHWIYLNIQTYWEYDKKLEYNNKLHHRMHSFVKNKYLTFNDNSLVIFPVYIEDHVVRFYEKFYKKKSVTYKPIFRITRKDAEKFDPNRDIIFELAQDRYTILNKTKEYNKIFAEKKSWYGENEFW